MKKRNFLIALCLVLLVVVCAVLVACNKTVYYTVTIVVTEGAATQTVTVDTAEGTAVTIPEGLVKEGHSITGWLVDGEEIAVDAPINGEITVEPIWTPNTYTVTLGEGGATKTVTYGEAYNFGIGTTNEIKTFAGWKYNGTRLTNEVGVGLANWHIASDVTLEAIWTDGATFDGLLYIEGEDGTLTVSAPKAYNFDDVVEIKSEINGKSVSTIGAMQYLSSYELIIPASVREISASAFAGNTYVNIVDLSAFSGKIGANAFKNSNVMMINLGKTTEIGASAFENSKANIIVIPATVTSIGDKALKSADIFEVDFAGDIPTLGEDVFGDGRRADNTNAFGERLSLIASVSTWEKFTGLKSDDAGIGKKVGELMGLEACYHYVYTDEQVDGYLQIAGIYTLGGDKVYRGFGSYAVIVDADGQSVEEIYGDTHYYTNIMDTQKRETYIFDYETRSVVKAIANENGETIVDGVLYDYQGSEIVYTVPQNVTELAAGVAYGNQTMRFLNIGDQVEKVGAYAFYGSFINGEAGGRLFGVHFGTGIKEIGIGAFFNQPWLYEIVFYGTEAPTIGSGAFFWYNPQAIMMAPTIMINNLSLYIGTYIYTPLSTSGGWFSPAPVQPFIDAFNASIEGVYDESNQLTIGGKPVEYSKSNFAKIIESGTYVQDAEYTAEFGKLIMTGVTNPSSVDGYAYVEFNDTFASGVKVGYAYYTS
ncbi:MAG: leucine-rich repeat protein, partial [Clostridia bacterium]|nr:leucine-rich repeat protein [Clostridia bacterium]